MECLRWSTGGGRLIFWWRVNIPIGCLAAGMMFFFIKTPANVRPASASLREKLINLDLLGSLSVMAATVCFVLAMHWAGTSLAWNSAPVVASLAACGVLSVLFAEIE